MKSYNHIIIIPLHWELCPPPHNIHARCTRAQCARSKKSWHHIFEFDLELTLHELWLESHGQSSSLQSRAAPLRRTANRVGFGMASGWVKDGIRSKAPSTGALKDLSGLETSV